MELTNVSFPKFCFAHINFLASDATKLDQSCQQTVVTGTQVNEVDIT